MSFEGRHDTADERFAAPAVRGVVRRVGAREVGGHLGARHVDQQLTTTLDVQTPSDVRGDVVLRTDRATALYNLTTTRCATRQPAVQRAVKRTLVQPVA